MMRQPDSSNCPISPYLMCKSDSPLLRKNWAIVTHSQPTRGNGITEFHFSLSFFPISISL